jgi:hypothetical protein
VSVKESLQYASVNEAEGRIKIMTNFICDFRLDIYREEADENIENISEILNSFPLTSKTSLFGH